MKNEDKMGTKNILPLLVEFSIPAIIGMLVNAIYNIVDRMFIGNAPELGAIGLAGISICYPVTLVLMAISLMIGMGGATRFSIALGQGKKEEAGKYMGNGLTLTIILGLVFMILGNVFLAPMLRLLGASKTVLPYAENYLSIILYGAVFQCIAMAGNNFSRAQGNPKNAMISQLIGAGFNILFDYILICIFHMGMQGAAFATIGGQFLSALWQLAFLMQISNSVLNIILNASLVKYGGDLALSAIGIVTSIQTLILMPITGLMQGQQPLISYNYGALKMNRVKETLKYAIIGATMIALIGFIAVQFFTKSIVYMFNDEADVVKLCSHALHIWFMCLPLIGAQVMCANYFQAIGKIKISSVLNLLRQIIILIPCIIIFSSIIGLDGIFIAVPVADLSAFIITVLLLKNALKKEA